MQDLARPVETIAAPAAAGGARGWAEPAAFRHRGALLVLVTLPLAAWTLAAPPPGAGEVGAGSLLVGAGVALRLAAVRRIGKRARVRRSKGATLVDSGPYAWTRNPLYVAALVMLGGLALLAGGGPWAWIAPALAWLAYTPVVIHEERVLHEALGDAYAGYAARVPRWVGLPARCPASPGEPFPWGEVLSRERALAPAMLGVAAFLVAVRARVVPLAAWIEAACGEDAAVPMAALVVGLLAVATVVTTEVQARRHVQRRLGDVRGREEAWVIGMAGGPGVAKAGPVPET